MPSRTQFVLDAIRHAVLTGALSPGQALVDADMAREVYDAGLPLEPEAVRRTVARRVPLAAAEEALDRADRAEDGAVLLGGCDKSTPALLMGAASVELGELPDPYAG